LLGGGGKAKHRRNSILTGKIVGRTSCANKLTNTCRDVLRLNAQIKHNSTSKLRSCAKAASCPDGSTEIHHGTDRGDLGSSSRYRYQGKRRQPCAKHVGKRSTRAAERNPANCTQRHVCNTYGGHRSNIKFSYFGMRYSEPPKC
jgi:hypothetical protein